MRPRPADDPRFIPIQLRRQLVADGSHDRAIERMLRGGVLAWVRHGAYFPGPQWADLDEAQRYEMRTRAAMLQARTPVVASHLSSAMFYESPTWGLDLTDVHLTRRDGRAGRREAGVRQHRGAIVEGDVVERYGVEVMSATRTALEVTMVADVDPAVAVVSHLLHHELTTTEALYHRYDQGMAWWPASLRTELVLRLADPRFESVGEVRVFMTCYRAGLPAPEPQVEVRDVTGRLLGRVDFAWPELKVFLEFDGLVKYHRYRRESETVEEMVIREKQREERICEETGWRCIRVSWADLQSPAILVNRIARLLGVRTVLPA